MITPRKFGQVALIVLAAGFAGSTANAVECKASSYQGSNASLLTGYSQNAARENAIVSWELRVISSIGPNWSKWDQATDRGFSCVKTGLGRWKCTAEAKPCKLD